MNVYQYTVLIIDDCAEDRQVYSRYLSKAVVSNYKIIEAECGEEGIEKIIAMQPDLILLDYMLPDFDGLELIAELEAEIAEIPPIVMLTGQGNEKIAVEAMKKGVKDYLVKGQLTPDKLNTSVKSVLQQSRLQSLLEKNLLQQQLIAQTSLKIRQSLELSEILHTVVEEVQLLLNCDRVIVYHFAPDMSGDIVAESVKPGWKKSLGAKIFDSCYKERNIIKKYEKGHALAVDDIYQQGFSKCHLKMLEDFQVKANVIVPIVLSPSTWNDNSTCLWGLLIAHKCTSTYHWQSDEIKLLDKLAVQLAIAIKQSELIANLKKELKEKKKLELELERRVQVLEASEDYIGLSTPEGKVIWNNPQMKQIMGMQKTTDISLSITDYHPHWAADIIIQQGIPTAISKGTWIGETALLNKENKEIPVSQLIIAHKSSRGKVEYISTVMRNLSKQKETENFLKERAKELEWVNLELMKTTSLLKKRNEELDRFAYVTSHDLKAPLRAIANLASWLGEDLQDQIPEENQQQLKLMQSRVKRMDGLIQGLLEYSRVGRKKTPIEVVDIKNMIDEVIDSLSPPPQFEIVVSPDMPTIKTKALLLQQVFTNLIGNAIKYHHKNEGKIIISVEDIGNCYQFTVSDDGPGIEPQYHERIFAIFQTLQARDTIESTGIGLSIVRKIIEDQGGRIGVKSQIGEGASFYFTWYK